MAGDRLHEFDLSLCDYVLCHVRPHLRELHQRPTEVARLHPSDWDQLELPTWAGSVIASLPSLLADYIWAGVTGDPVWLPLNDDELSDLQGVVDDPPMRLVSRLEWEPYDALHQRYVHCISEISTNLTKQTAEEWAVDCAGFTKRLCRKGLLIAEGITIVHEWLWKLRRLLQAMGAIKYLPAPAGLHPTPTIPDPRTGVPLSEAGEEQFWEAVRLLRDEISKSPDGWQTKAKTLIEKAGIRAQVGRHALRWLESLGEYRGYSRKKPERYKSKE